MPREAMKQSTSLELHFLRLAAIVLASGTACRASPAPGEAERLFSDAPPTWVAPLPELRLSADGNRAAFGSGAWLSIVDLNGGGLDEAFELGRLDYVSEVEFWSGRMVARRGTKGAQTGWFLDDRWIEEVPPDAVLRFSPESDALAFFERGTPKEVTASGVNGFSTYAFESAIRALEWSVDGSRLFLLLTDETGRSSLTTLDPLSGARVMVAEDLDLPLRGASMGVGPDGGTVFLPLASDSGLDLEARHRPDADRDVDIYALDLESGLLSLEVDGPMDDLFPRLMGGYLYWTRIVYAQSIVAVAFSGGDAFLVAEGGQIPYWSHDGGQIAYTVGRPGAADAPLNMDVDIVEVDEAAQPIASPRRLIQGYHEDFTPAWSPEGSWLAFHSHRSPTAVPAYHSDGATDDLFLLRRGDVIENEIRLTDFGWEVGMADWAPDGRRLVFVSWDRGAPGIGIPWMVTIDSESGEAIEIERLGLPEPLRSARLLAFSPRAEPEELAIENDEGDGRQSIWIQELRSGTLRKLVDYESDTYSGLDWTPDGTAIVYSARSDGRYQLFAIPASGGEPRKLSDDSAQLMQPQVSPDGRWVAASRIELTRELWRRSDLQRPFRASTVSMSPRRGLAGQSSR